jgi:phage gp46-like protein
MSDIKTHFVDFEHGADWLFDAPALEDDDGLTTALIISLFTDARALDSDVTPSPDDDRGWWGDAWPLEANDRIGSRLWLLGRRKQLLSVLAEAQGYAQEALRWLVDDSVAQRVEVEAFIPRDAILGLSIAVYRPQATPARYRFVWEV